MASEARTVEAASFDLQPGTQHSGAAISTRDAAARILLRRMRAFIIFTNQSSSKASAMPIVPGAAAAHIQSGASQ